jgi:chromosome partitioning protein
MALIIACLSQKGGVGKSTIARLLARTYASAGWRVKIADFNVKQKTSVDWVSLRMSDGIEPAIAAEPYTSPKALKREDYDLVIADGKPDSDQTSLELARLAAITVLPTGLSGDDLKPQLMFANELVSKGVDKARILFVLNKTVESDLAVLEARQYLTMTTGFRVAEQDLAAKTGYQMAQNIGLAISETKFPTLNEKADALAAQIVARVNALEEANG